MGHSPSGQAEEVSVSGDQHAGSVGGRAKVIGIGGAEAQSLDGRFDVESPFPEAANDPARNLFVGVETKEAHPRGGHGASKESAGAAPRPTPRRP